VYIYVYYYLIVMHVFLPYVLFQARLTTYKAKCQFPYRVYDENTTYTTFQDNGICNKSTKVFEYTEHRFCDDQHTEDI